MSDSSSLDNKTFKSLIILYTTALGIIALLVLISQIFIQKALAGNEYDANIINIAGKQRMLSQKISKGMVLLKAPDITTKRNIETELLQAYNEWKRSHTVLKNNVNSLPKTEKTNTLKNQFAKVTIEINELSNIFEHVNNDFYLGKEESTQWVTSFISKEPKFLIEMNKYVNDYEHYSSSKIKSIKKIEFVTFILLILLLLVEIFLLFIPAAGKIKKTISELIQTKDQAVEMAKKANIAVQQKKEALEELQLLQKAIDQNLFFARFDNKGHIVNMGRRIKELISKQKNTHKHIIYENLGLNFTEQSNLKNLVNSGKGAILNHEYKVSLEKSDIEWFDISVFPVVMHQGVIEYIIVCLDITSRKNAQAKIDDLNLKKVQNQAANQKVKASLIVEAQEEERKRIAKDIHDSIGQMLTALKFNIESLNPEQQDKLPEKINNLKAQTKNIILGVRMATFNLTPPELLDYGIATAIQKMVSQLNKYSNAEVIFKNEINEDMRFENLVETNLYRVTQESINNAIKYAQAEYILVTLKKTDQLLSISITDNGNGFDKNKLPKKPKGGTEGGMGVFFMKERMEYINGRVFINSEPGNGTRIVLNYPIPYTQ